MANIIDRASNPSSSCLNSPSHIISSSARETPREHKLRMTRSASILPSTLFTFCHLTWRICVVCRFSFRRLLLSWVGTRLIIYSWLLVHLTMLRGLARMDRNGVMGLSSTIFVSANCLGTMRLETLIINQPSIIWSTWSVRLWSPLKRELSSFPLGPSGMFADRIQVSFGILHSYR